ncbi:efflux RND transporter periplasmic adaptor subunit [bacterium]|jgi:HlyD family secretion protein|nr:efflux RND transporter periplasmic adaptor subunit [bacterium]
MLMVLRLVFYVAANLFFLNQNCTGTEISQRLRAVARTAQIDEIYEESAVVSTENEARISSKIMGTISALPGHVGQRVKKGDVLALVDSRELKLRVEQVAQNLSHSKKAVLQSKELLVIREADLKRLQKSFERAKKFLKTKVTTEEQFETVEAAYIQAQAQMESAKQGLLMAQLQTKISEHKLGEAQITLSHTIISAPFDGLITQRFKEPGELTLPGSPLLMLNDTSQFQLKTHLRESAVGLIKPGDELRIRVGEETLSGQVSEISPRVDPLSRTFQVKIGFSTTKSVFVGMYARVFLPSGKRTVILIPHSAIHRRGQLEMVRILEGTEVSTRYVKIDDVDVNGEVEVRAGLSGGEVLLLQKSRSGEIK